MADQPKPVPAEVVDAIKRGDYVVCYAKCWPCQFGQHDSEPHTWMDDEDIEHAGLPIPSTPEGRGALVEDRPCGCHCMARGQATTDNGSNPLAVDHG